jgi:vancomycin resistance protein VanW
VVDQKIIEIVRRKRVEDNPHRKVFSRRYPILLPYILGGRRLVNNARNYLNWNISKQRTDAFFDKVIARHSSPLFRKLGESKASLQIGKVKNLRIATEALQGLVIPPGKVFSFWTSLGAPTAKRGYTNGMLISNGVVLEGVGGGLCQLSNLLYWLFLHSPVEILERRHHSRDVFPDNGRTIPFGAGATVFYNLIDLKVRNTSKYPLQLKLWLTDGQLKGQILSTSAAVNKYHLIEKNHHFVKAGESVYRYNEIWREILVDGQLSREEKLMTNCAQVMYDTALIKSEEISLVL